MVDVPQMILIGSAGRNAGKTEWACSVIRKFSNDIKIVGIKVTAIKQDGDSCPRGGTGCGVCSSLKGKFRITNEINASSGKDTARLLAAGASEVFWLRVTMSHLQEGFSALLDKIPSDAMLICESNSLRHVVHPGLFVMVRNDKTKAYKASAEAVREYADRIIVSDGTRFNFDLADIEISDRKWILKQHATAILKAGGESKRMTQDKSMLLIHGHPMIEHVCQQLRGHFDQLLVSADDAHKYAFLGLDVVPDEVPGQGPLMGLASTLEASVNELNVVVACDIPEIDMTLLRQMLSLADGYDIVLPRSSEGLSEPLFAVYRKSVCPIMQKALSSGERWIRAIYDGCRTRYIDLPETRQIININTMKEYETYVG